MGEELLYVLRLVFCWDDEFLVRVITRRVLVQPAWRADPDLIVCLEYRESLFEIQLPNLTK